MSKHGAILIIDQDREEKDLLEEIFRDLQIQNEIKWFFTGKDVIDFLNTTVEDIFLIFCDVSLPRINGLELKKIIDGDPYLRKKSIPFVFYSTSAKQDDVNDAYSKMTVQGFFEKGTNYEKEKEQIQLIVEYWKKCRHPNFG